MQKLIAVLMFGVLTSSLEAQVYHFDQTYEYFQKTIAFGTVHGYIPIITDTTDSIPMRWIARKDSTMPSEWVINFDDQNNLYLPVEHLDSADFFLKPPGTFDQKMIIGLAHNLAPARASIYFTIFPQHDRADSTVIEFDFNIIYVQLPNDTSDTSTQDTTGQTGLSKIALDDEIRFLWKEQLTIESEVDLDQITIYSPSGQLLWEEMKPGRVMNHPIDRRLRYVIVAFRKDEKITSSLIFKQAP